MTYELPKTILERFLSKKFVILGRAGLDLYPNPIGLSTQDADNFISDLGGSAANIAVSMSKLGCDTFLCSTFSDDSVGDFIQKKGSLGSLLEINYLIQNFGVRVRNSLCRHSYRNRRQPRQAF